MEGLAVRAAALADIRAYAAEARRLKVTHEQLAEAVGVKKSTWYKIVNGTVKS
jgi:DNA-binding XRE family transcriptional regulator